MLHTSSIKTFTQGSFVALIATAALACGPANAQSLFALFAPAPQQQVQPQYEALPAARGDAGEDAQIDPRFRRQLVDYRTAEAPGTIIIDTPHTYLYLVMGNGKAMRYGIGVGREGFTWSGVQHVARKAEWPDWYPPAQMIKRQPYLPRVTMGGPGNPLGARALYLGSSEYRIHGTNAPSTIGKQVSSGCIRLTNEDVTDLYNRVKLGAKVVVLPATVEARASARSRQAQQIAPTPVSLSQSYASQPESRASRAWSNIR